MVLLDATLPPVGVTPILDVRARYLERHLPGALFFDIEELSDRSTPLPHMLPSADYFSREMSKLGIRNDDSLVFYEQEGVFSAPRAWWMLRTFGVEQVFILDGGLRAWVEAGLPTETGPVQRPAANFEASLQGDAVKSFPAMQQEIAGRAQILDARPQGRFDGSAPEPRPGIRSGHMPGATSIPYTDLVSHGRLKSPEDLLNVFAAKHVDLQQPTTTTCGSGVTAAVLVLGLEICGAKKVSLYDGSWAEFAGHPDALIETAS